MRSRGARPVTRANMALVRERIEAILCKAAVAAA
jgi:hypothetical protein